MKYLVENVLPLAVISIDAKENMRERESKTESKLLLISENTEKIVIISIKI